MEAAGKLRAAALVDEDVRKIKQQEAARQKTRQEEQQLDDLLSLEEGQQERFSRVQREWEVRTAEAADQRQQQRSMLAAQQAREREQLTEVWHLQAAVIIMHHASDCHACRAAP